MAPRLHLQKAAKQLRLTTNAAPQYVCWQCRHASAATASATTPAPSIDQMTNVTRPILRHPSTQPPSYKPPEFRKSQLHRQYQSVLRSSPLMLLFQHNNIKAVEWTGIRRELANALKKADEELARNGDETYIGQSSKIQIVQTGIFASALKIVEFWEPKYLDGPAVNDPTNPSVDSSKPSHNTKPTNSDPSLTHGLSKNAYFSAKNAKLQHGLEPLLSGPMAILTLPSVSPAHVKAAMSILAPSKQIPAPKRRITPSYYDAPVQTGLGKLMFLGARVEGKVFDMEGAKWVGSIEGGLTNTLESAGKSLYLTVEGRRGMLEDEQKEGEPKEESSQ
jgi:large subunit ribosomal protein L10